MMFKSLFRFLSSHSSLDKKNKAISSYKDIFLSKKSNRCFATMFDYSVTVGHSKQVDISKPYLLGAIAVNSTASNRHLYFVYRISTSVF